MDINSIPNWRLLTLPARKQMVQMVVGVAQKNGGKKAVQQAIQQLAQHWQVTTKDLDAWGGISGTLRSRNRGRRQRRDRDNRKVIAQAQTAANMAFAHKWQKSISM